MSAGEHEGPEEELPATESDTEPLTTAGHAEQTAELIGIWSRYLERALDRINAVLWRFVKMFLLIVLAVLGYAVASGALGAMGSFVGRGLP